MRARGARRRWSPRRGLERGFTSQEARGPLDGCARVPGDALRGHVDAWVGRVDLRARARVPLLVVPG